MLGLNKAAYFIESLGFGLFPKLIETLENTDTTDIETPEEEFELALEQFAENYQILSNGKV